MKKPVIAINANMDKKERLTQLHRDYSKAVLEAGGIPVILPPLIASEKDILQILNRIDGLILSGGYDVNPNIYGEKVLNKTVIPLPKIKQDFDFRLFKLAYKKNIPILGICYGCQLINVALGGKLFQDIKTQLNTRINHRKTYHQIHICDGTLLHRIIGKKMIEVNSRHHQSAKEPGKGVIINARSTDTIIEGIEVDNESKFCLGVQWHPENIVNKKEQLALFTALIKACKLV